MISLRSVLFVVPRFHTNLFFATRALVDAGIRTTIWCTEQSHIEDYSCVEPTIIAKGECGFAATRARLSHLDPDLVILRDVGSLSKHVFLAGSLQRRTMLAYDQKPYLRSPRSVFAGLQNLLRGKPARRLTPVPGMAGRGSVPDPRACYIPWPVDVPPAGFLRDYAPDGRTRILCVGKLTQPRKNHLVLLAALERLQPQRDFTVTLVGSSSVDIRNGSRRHLDTIVDRCSSPTLKGRVTVLRDVPFRSMGQFYGRHDVCVLPARGEPLGSSPLEGMAWGAVPVISSECGSAGYIAGTDVGSTFAPSDEQELAARLDPLLGNTPSLAAHGQRASAYARDELGPERFVARLAAAAARGSDLGR